MPRFVILCHETPPGHHRGRHWDLMLEHGDLLRSWALEQEPRPGATIGAAALADHRTLYLDYEGPVSGDRGHVSRWDAGDYTIQYEDATRLRLRLLGGLLEGTVTLTRDRPDGQRWKFTYHEDFEIPPITSLHDFRRWAVSDLFPQQGRIDYIDGRVEIDLSPENLYRHGVLKTELIRVLVQRSKSLDLGELFSDRTRVLSVPANLSAEPDLVFVSHATFESDRVRLVPVVSGAEGDYIEIEGPPDLVVEIVSQHSRSKDRERLPAAYYAAGVQEYWLADGLEEQLSFVIHQRGETSFAPVTVDDDGFQASQVLSARYQLQRTSNRHGHWAYDLVER